MSSGKSQLTGSVPLNGRLVFKVDDRTWSKVYCVLGAQWGDEGKGKIVDLLACEMDVVCRCAVSKTAFALMIFSHDFVL